MRIKAEDELWEISIKHLDPRQRIPLPRCKTFMPTWQHCRQGKATSGGDVQHKDIRAFWAGLS